jgi:hypothetical protein
VTRTREVKTGMDKLAETFCNAAFPTTEWMRGAGRNQGVATADYGRDSSEFL